MTPDWSVLRYRDGFPWPLFVDAHHDHRTGETRLALDPFTGVHAQPKDQQTIAAAMLRDAAVEFLDKRGFYVRSWPAGHWGVLRYDPEDGIAGPLPLPSFPTCGEALCAGVTFILDADKVPE